MKKIVSTLLAIAMLFSCSVNAFADYDLQDSKPEQVSSAIAQEKAMANNAANSQCLVSRPTPLNPQNITRGVSKPTQKYTFSGYNPYYGSFTDVCGGIYTNYYFTGYSIYNVGFTGVSVSSDCTFYYSLIDMETGNSVGGLKKASFSADSSNEAGSSYDVLPDHKYCVFFRTDYSASASGTVSVSYSTR